MTRMGLFPSTAAANIYAIGNHLQKIADLKPIDRLHRTNQRALGS
jgi:hypothetical protein